MRRSSCILAAAIFISTLTGCGNWRKPGDLTGRSGQTGTNIPRQQSSPTASEEEPQAEKPEKPQKKKKGTLDPDYVPRGGFR